MRRAILATALICGLSAPVAAQQKESDAVPVGTAYAERRAVEKTLDLVGRVESINRVQIRARVTGFLDAVRFKEGDAIKEGDPLYRIEQGLFKAAVEQAQGALERSKAAKVLTVIQLQRAEDLLTKQAGTAVARDQALAANQQAQGAIMSDEANLTTANINLGYTDIASPISGRVGKTNITRGNVVGPDSGVLTIVVSQDPMYVTFPVSQREFLKGQSATQEANAKTTKVRIRFSDGAQYDQVGEINFVNVTVDRTTDTVLVRATMPNPKSALIDGQLVRVVLETGAPQQQVVVPQAALIADQGGVYVFAVEDGKAVVKRIKPGGENGADVVVDQGLSGGEQIIVEGLQSVRPGTAVRASPLPSSLSRS